jgi:hypothetical protein
VVEGGVAACGGGVVVGAQCLVMLLLEMAGQCFEAAEELADTLNECFGLWEWVIRFELLVLPPLLLVHHPLLIKKYYPYPQDNYDINTIKPPSRLSWPTGKPPFHVSSLFHI